eukprot:m.51582 g.51582  ORF g.51582 m.51582 type:complete len:443 (-) comp48323_c1_seq10:458-1786(-)
MCCSVCVDVVIMSCLCVCRCRTCAHVSVRLVGQCFQDSLISFGSTEYSADLRMERLKNALHGGLRGPPSADFLRYIEEHQLTCLYLLNEHLQTTGQKIPPGLNAVQFGKLKLWLSGHASRSKVHSLLQSDDFHNIAFAFTLDDSLLIRLFPDAPLHHLLTDTLTDDFDAITRRNIYALRDASTQPIGQPLSSGTSSPRSLTRSPPSTGTGSFSPASAHSRSGAAHVYTPPQVVSFSKPSETSHPSSPSVGGSPHSPSSASASTSARTSTAEFPVSPQYTAAVQTPFVPVVPVPEPPRPARLGQDDEISAEIEDLIENHLEYKWTETDRTMEMLRADHQKKFDAERFVSLFCLSFCIFVYLSFSVSGSVSVFLSLCLFFCLCVSVFLSLCVCPSLSLCLCLSLSLSIVLSLSLCLYVSVVLCLCLSFCLCLSCCVCLCLLQDV